jgi:predicted metal-dependent phosphoesterase TrpH
VTGLAEGAQEATRLGLRFIPGIELTTDADLAEIHILGYHLDYTSPDLLAKLDEVKSGRIERAKEMVRRVQSLGFDVTWEEVWELAGDHGFVGRGQIFRVMLAKGLVSRNTAGESFTKYFSRGGLAYVEHSYLAPEEALRMIREAGGVPVLAHPGRAAADEIIAALVRAGLMGIEAYYPAHDPYTTAHYLAIANRYGLIATGGTDYHGHFSGRGLEMGTFTAPVEVLDQLDKAARKVKTGRTQGS